MQVKIDTKEKFYVITLMETNLTANMTDEMQGSLLTYLKNTPKNVLFNLQDINFIDDAAAEALINIQHAFYEEGVSFVVFNMKPELRKLLDKTGLLEIINEVPTEAEAGDIVMMEEIERKLLEEG